MKNPQAGREVMIWLKGQLVPAIIKRVEFTTMLLSTKTDGLVRRCHIDCFTIDEALRLSLEKAAEDGG